MGRAAEKNQHFGAGGQLDLKATVPAGLGDHQVQKGYFSCRIKPWLRPLNDQSGPAGTATPSAVATTRRGPVEVRQKEEEEELCTRVSSKYTTKSDRKLGLTNPASPNGPLEASEMRPCFVQISADPGRALDVGVEDVGGGHKTIPKNTKNRIIKKVTLKGKPQKTLFIRR